MSNKNVCFSSSDTSMAPFVQYTPVLNARHGLRFARPRFVGPSDPHFTIWPFVSRFVGPSGPHPSYPHNRTH